MQTNKTTQPPAYLRLADMCARYRVSGSTIWNWVHTNGLPAPKRLGPNTSAWSLAELMAWESSRQTATR